MLKSRLDEDVKKALLDGDKERATLLRGLKSAILYAEVAKGVRSEGLSDASIVEVLQKESKKRAESADLYAKAGDKEREAAELAEKSVIDAYLPQQLSDDELAVLVEDAVVRARATDVRHMGAVIAQVKQEAGASADGKRIADMVKERLVK